GVARVPELVELVRDPPEVGVVLRRLRERQVEALEHAVQEAERDRAANLGGLFPRLGAVARERASAERIVDDATRRLRLRERRGVDARLLPEVIPAEPIVARDDTVAALTGDLVGLRARRDDIHRRARVLDRAWREPAFRDLQQRALVLELVEAERLVDDLHRFEHLRARLGRLDLEGVELPEM